MWDEWLAAERRHRDEAGLTRVLHPRRHDEDVVDLAGNDYLGLSRHPLVRQAAAEAALRWGAGAGASRLVTGTLALHAELEEALAGLMRQPAALVFSTGYHANLGVVSALAGRDAHVVSDAHVHASLIDAVRLSRAGLTVVPHNDVDAVRTALSSRPETRQLVLAESVYSVLGDPAPLRELAEECRRHEALLLVDEAHGLGVHGPGLVAATGLAGMPHVLVTATLSKALGSQGGAVLGPRAVVDHLVNRARPFVFDTALAPAATAAALAAVRLLGDAPELPALIARRTAELARLLDVPVPGGAVVSVTLPSAAAAVAAAAACADRGVRVGCFRPPSVPDGVSRLRITVNAGVPDAEWERAVRIVLGVVREHQTEECR